jgi:hypothetical protein
MNCQENSILNTQLINSPCFEIAMRFQSIPHDIFRAQIFIVNLKMTGRDRKNKRLVVQRQQKHCELFWTG